MLKDCFLLLLVVLSLPAWARNWNAKVDWRAIGDGKTGDSPAIQRGVAALRSGDSVVFPAPGIYFVASTVNFRAAGIRVEGEPGAPLVGPNRGTDIFGGLQPDTAIGGSATTGRIFRGGGIQAHGRGRDGGQTLDQTIFKPHDCFDSHHRMFIEINTGNGFGNPAYDAGIENFRVYDNDSVSAGGPYPEAKTFGLSAPFARVKQPETSVYTSISVSKSVWYNNLLKGVINSNEYAGISIPPGAGHMKICKDTVMATVVDASTCGGH